MTTKKLTLRRSGVLAGLASLALTGHPALADLLVVANDEKTTWDDAGNPVYGPPGKDTVQILDIKNRLAPRVVAQFALQNTVVGPPTNLAITPDESLALVVNSLNGVADGAAWKMAPDNKLSVIDLKVTPPAVIATVEIGKQASGLDISWKGDLCLVANRADNSVSVLSIKGKEVKLIDTVPMGDSVTSIAITPDGRHALASKFTTHKVALLNIDGQKVTYNKVDLPVGLWPYNVKVTPDGKLGLTADNGNSGSSDGNIDTVSVIDLEATPPRVIDRVVVGDAPEGLAISPTGKIAVAVLLNGSGAIPKGAWYAHKNAVVSVLSIDGKKVKRIGEVEVGPLAEGVAFSPDGKYIYLGNFISGDMSILKVEGGKVTNTGKVVKLAGHPAALRGSTH